MSKVNLKVRTEYSVGKAYAPLELVIQQLLSEGVTAAAMVDDTTWGHVRFYNACKEAGIQPLLGATSIVSDVAEMTPKMWFIAKNKEGLSELYQALSMSYKQKVATKKGAKPRLYFDDVLNMSDNIFKFCGGVLNRGFLKILARRSPDTFFIDIADNGSVIENDFKKNLANALSIKTVTVHENNCVYEGNSKLLPYFRSANSSLRDLTLKTPEEGQDLAIEIAKQCEGLELPIAPTIHLEGDLEQACRAAIPERFPNGWPQEYEARLQHELEEIRGKKFDSYFLLVQDMVCWAKKHMLIGPARGSAASSLVCYLLHITEIDPIPPRLYFERFIDKSRKDFPDIDIDVPDEKRQMLIEYLKDRWGSDHVAHVGNVIYYRPFSALYEVTNKLSIPAEIISPLKKVMISRKASDPRFTKCLEDTLMGTQEGQNALAKFPALAEAASLEGHVSHTGVHAGGILVCNDEVSKYCVVDSNNIAHVDKHACEQVNLLKVDCLGLRTLSVLADVQSVKDWYHIPVNDAKTFDVFNKRLFCGVFQFEGGSMRNLASQVHFSSLDEIDAVTALARPGPMASGIDRLWLSRHDGAPYQSKHPLVARVLARTFELPIYQEDTMALVREVGGFGWDETSKVRKAVSKSQGNAALAPYKELFVKNAQLKGLSIDVVQELWAEIVRMGAYQMNKSHTFAYANVSYWTAYAKAHYPLEFAASTLNHAKDEESAVALLKELTSEGLQYTYFDPEKSKEGWSVQDGMLIGGFSSLNGIGAHKAHNLVKQRETSGLTDETAMKLLAYESPFKELYPLYKKYARYYAPDAMKWGFKVCFIRDIPEPARTLRRVFIAKLTYIDKRSLDEAQARKQRMQAGSPYYVLRFKDDSDEIGGKIQSRNIEMIKAADDFMIGDEIIVQAEFYRGLRFAFVLDMSKLTDARETSIRNY